jgi:hypothetical protein
MECRIPDMQPVRFYKPGLTPDWSSYFPNLDNAYHREMWTPGVNETKYYTDWIINKEMSIQLRVTVEGTENLTVYQLQSDGSYSAVDTIIPTEITPVGWVSEKVNRYNYTPSSEGVYYLDSSTAGYRSDKFVVHSSLKFKKRLLQISYYNSENDYGMVFFDGETSRYTGLAYLTGGLYIDTPGNEISAFKTDRGEVDKLRATPTKTALLKIADLHYLDAMRVNMILSCDNITVNGITYQNEEPPEIDSISNTDLVNMQVKLTQTNYEYFIS